MRSLAVGFSSAMLLALLLTPQVRRLAIRLGALDRYSARKVLGGSTVPRLGGLAIAVAFYVTWLLLWFGQSTLAVGAVTAWPPLAALLLGGLPILLLGCVDDLRGMRALTKLTVQVTVSVLLWYAGLRISGPVLGWDLPRWLSLLLTVLWITGVINAVNLIDGLDGLASGVALFALSSTAVIAMLRGELVLALLVVTLAGAVAGFLVFNWNPASIIMGDAGSMFLGYLLATTSIWTVQKSATIVLAVLPAVTLGLPLLDTSLTIGRRLLSGRPVMLADRDHVHHRLLGRGLSHRQAVMLLYAVCAVFSGLSIGMVLSGPVLSKLLLLLAALFAGGLAYALGYVGRGPEGVWEGLRRRRRNRAILRRLSSLGHQLQGAQQVADLQQAVREFAQALGTVDLTLVLDGSEAADRSETGTSYPIRTLDGVVARLELNVDERHISPDDRVLMQLLCDMLAPPLCRLSRRR
ncbi:MAG: MraY family glycosyltransferase [Myxococcales bacterium]|nr:undecaprenyl/decaprenyl-phosphate alpha-N-acetylglucosaminyl 1-phosphate transferase [Myxococcota bacterium]MDW8280169.1 MraY family glycosyltransferase [Myxococcales bacterium]